MNDISVGFIIGLVQSGLGHPFDTVKTLLQNGQTFRDLKPLSYYRGVTYPTVASLVFNVTTFPLYGYYYEKTKNAYYSGMISGIAIAPIDYAFSVGKIRRQTLTPVPLHFKGITLNCLRTVIAMATYFGVYNDLTGECGPLIAGAAAGVANWTVTYPLDVVSTRQIAGNLSVMQAFRGPLFRGYGACVTRAIIVNSATFYVYEKFKE